MNNTDHIWLIVMAGGTGNRFWPVSRSESPKQFLDVMGIGCSMLQATVARFESLCRPDHTVVVTGEQFVAQVREQLPQLPAENILGEPLRRNTAPCIALAAAFIRRHDAEAMVVVAPSDHAIFRLPKFEADLRQAIDTVRDHDWIITFGAQPVSPSTIYGYIQMSEAPSLPGVNNLYRAITFSEKPPVEIARQFIASGEFFWNTGILVWRLPVLQEVYRRYLPELYEAFLGADEVQPEGLEAVYATLRAVSVDNGIMELADNVQVMIASFGWSDVETWESLYSVSPHDAGNNVVQGSNVLLYNTHNCMISISDGRTVVLDGLDGYIVADTPTTLMVCPRSREEMVFRYASDVELKKLIDKK